MILKTLTFLLAVYCFDIKQVFSQSIAGEYSYSNNHFNIHLNLSSDGTFYYYDNGQIQLRECQGNWQERSGNLILDSYPQKEKMVCYEYLNRKVEYISINVKKKSDGRPIHYSLYLLKNSGDTIQLKEQFKTSKVFEKDINGFFIVDMNGTQSSTYMFQRKGTNTFDVLFETERVLDNEDWRITETGIQPRNDAGNYANFILQKVVRN